MEMHIILKGAKEPLIIKGDRIEILDYNLQGVDYKQVRYYKKGFSKSQYIKSDLIVKIKELKKVGI